MELWPAEARHDELVCQLVVVDVNDPPQYRAMSYVWGDENDKDEILCEVGWVVGALKIPRNLAAALRRIRHSELSQVLWADSICIDQSNNLEKNHQIGIMGRIYKSAVQVIVWLGEVELVRHLDVVECMKELARFENAWTRARESFATEYENSISLYNEIKAKFSNSAVRRTKFKSFLGFIQNPYWDRAWTFQETFLARSLCFLHGEFEIEQEDIYRSIIGLGNLFEMNNMYDKERHVNRLLMQKLVNDVAKGVKEVLEENSTEHGQSVVDEKSWEHHIITVLLQIRALDQDEINECGIHKNAQGLIKKMLTPGENARNEKVFDEDDFQENVLSHLPGRWAPPVMSRIALHPTFVGRELLSFRKLMTITQGTKCKHAVDIVYSLLGMMENAVFIMPDYNKDHVQVFGEAILNIIRLEDDLGVLGDAEIGPLSTTSQLPSWMPDWRFPKCKNGILAEATHLFSCTGDTSPFLSMSPDFRRLSLRGAVIDNVVNLISPLDTQQYLDTLGIDELQIERILCCDLAIFDQDRIPRRWDQEHDERIRLTRTELLEHKTWNVPFPLGRITGSIEDKRLMVTRRGRVGTAATNAAVGDHVALLLGGKVPVLIRPTATENQFLFVGQCYVEGIMDGQAMKLQDRGPDKDFVLV